MKESRQNTGEEMTGREERPEEKKRHESQAELQIAQKIPDAGTSKKQPDEKIAPANKDADKQPKETESKEKAKPVVEKTEEGKSAQRPDEKKPAKKAVKAKKTRPTNCVVCNKVFKHRLWYYRNGQYFCNKRCWNKFSKEKKAQENIKKEQQTASKQPSIGDVSDSTS